MYMVEKEYDKEEDNDEYDDKDDDKNKDYKGRKHSSNTQKVLFNFGNSLTMKEKETTNEQRDYEEDDDKYEDDYE
ncbi:hypothetical protein F8M41_009801 [Gigaspora margarita]|uniref:Uncharacterized protein n=1 Tax=Gigaspora margarita TaxID=4874 RepID=A0A8H3X1K2_GIGMA|nr:hypothetical protein F8M41_009801 [Gigaspora margarita]